MTNVIPLRKPDPEPPLQAEGRASPAPRFRISLPQKTPAPVRKALAAFEGRSARFLDWLSVDAERRRRASVVLAIALNLILMTTLAVYGTVKIWIPSAPGESMQVVMIDLAPLPELRDPELKPEPEAVKPPPEPEIVKEPPPEPEPAVEPEPEPEPERAREPEIEPEPEPAPILDLTPEPDFSPPEEEPAAVVTQEAPALDEGQLSVGDRTQEDAPQTPAEEAPPLISAPSADDLAEQERKKKEEEEAAAAAAPPPQGDDMFDEAPVLARPRLPLPAIDLPEGTASAAPGQSGVVAIFCNEQFRDKDKAAECAGRTDLRSGWRPGASGEKWDEAIRLLREGRARGEDGPDPRYDPNFAVRAEELKSVDDLTDFRKSQDAVNAPQNQEPSILHEGDRPAIGGKAFEPSWTLKDDPDVSAKDAEKLKQELEESEKNKRSSPDE
jgi:outer membrane biosynthesis protein TonB